MITGMIIRRGNSVVRFRCTAAPSRECRAFTDQYIHDEHTTNTLHWRRVFHGLGTETHPTFAELVCAHAVRLSAGSQ